MAKSEGEEEEAHECAHLEEVDIEDALLRRPAAVQRSTTTSNGTTANTTTNNTTTTSAHDTTTNYATTSTINTPTRSVPLAGLLSPRTDSSRDD